MVLIHSLGPNGYSLLFCLWFSCGSLSIFSAFLSFFAVVNYVRYSPLYALRFLKGLFTLVRFNLISLKYVLTANKVNGKISQKARISEAIDGTHTNMLEFSKPI